MQLKTVSPSPQNKWGNAYVTGEKHGLFWTTNGWSWHRCLQPPGNFIKLDVGDDYYSMEFRQMSEMDKLHFVRAYPTGGLGSLGARYEHNGMTTGNIPKLPGRRGFEGMATDVFDMRAVAELTGGIPCIVRDLPQINGWFDWDFDGDGKINTFLDLYLNDVDNPEWSGEYTGTINGIGYNRTKAWNINVWAMLTTNEDHTDREKSRRRWSGGRFVKRVRASNGENFNVYYKRETAGKSNNFNLLSLHSLDRENITDIDVTDILHNVILGNDWIRDIKKAGFTPRDDMRNPDERMVLDGLHGFGNEVWTGSGKIFYSKYAWQVDDKRFGFGHPAPKTVAERGDVTMPTPERPEPPPAPPEREIRSIPPKASKPRKRLSTKVFAGLLAIGTVVLVAAFIRLMSR